VIGSRNSPLIIVFDYRAIPGNLLGQIDEGAQARSHVAASWIIEAQRQGSDDPEFGKQYALKNIIHQTVSRLGQPMDIAAAVCFLASPLTDFMTGTTFRIDGGSTPTV
jgi:NAD(P)-dependent dehydrogenase (short-subunit alcohol dehydrogenase family)